MEYLEFKMEYCNTGSINLERVFALRGQCEDDLKYEIKWDSDQPAAWEGHIGMGNHLNTKLEVREPFSDELKIITTGSLGMVCINPSIELNVEGKIGKIERIGMGIDTPHEKWHITNNMHIDVECPNKFPVLNKEAFTEEVKALQYDLERVKDVPARDKLVEEFTKREFKRLWNSCDSKDQKKEFFVKTWDLTEMLSRRGTEYDNYEDFLEEYFDGEDE